MNGATAHVRVIVRKLRTREVVPISEHPNFRDHGRTVDAPLLRVLANLQRRHGECFASEAGLRRMICEDVGHMPGVDTVPCALERLEAQGLLEQRWLKPGGILPDGSVCTHGTRLVIVPRCRIHRRGLAARARRDGTTNRVQERMLQTLEQARASAMKPPPPADDRARALERKRAEDLARLAQLADAWALEDAAKGRPPDT
jgi:hypothetical protein